MDARPIDLLIRARWIIPVEPAETVLEQHAIAIHEGNILDILPANDAKQRYTAKVTCIRDQHAVLPGLVNSHTHSPMALFRGLADDLPLMDWLQNHIWPAEATWLNPEFIAAGTELALAEMLRSGTTCFNEHYLFPDTITQTTQSAGMRACIGLFAIDPPTAWAQNIDECLQKAQTVYEQYHGTSPLIHFSMAPHAPYTLSDEALIKVRTLAESLDLSIHMHVHETASELQNSLEAHGKRPLQRLQDLGLLNARFQAVHMTHVHAEDIALLKTTGAHVVTCPESNLKLASGFCPTHQLTEAGINIALGTDGAASNNDLDMFGEMRTTALLAKAVAQEATAISAPQALRMATLNGAKALGLEDRIGSLQPGKAADIIAVDLDALNTAPVYHPISQLVYAAQSQQVTDVWVAGKPLLHEKVLTTLSEERILANARAWSERIAPK